MDLNNSVKKRLWCIVEKVSKLELCINLILNTFSFSNISYPSTRPVGGGRTYSNITVCGVRKSSTNCVLE